MNHSDASGMTPAKRLLRGLTLAAALAVSVFGGGGCAVSPNHIRPPVDMPGQWRSELAADGMVSHTWWTLYHDDTLNTLVELALERNHDLAIA